MIPLKRQYFLSYAVIGSVMPLISVFLRQEGGFNFLQIGIATSLMALPMLFSPVIMTFLADRNVDPRRIMAFSFLASATMLSGIFFSRSISLTLALYFFHGLFFVAMMPLLDGIFFTSARSNEGNDDQKGTGYPLVRVWGTIGFIVPSLILYYPLREGAPASTILPVAVLFCLLSLGNSFLLPAPEKKVIRRRQIPTRAALDRLFSPEGRWLAIGLFFAFLGASTYYAFIANYFDEAIGIPKEWIGLIINFGVLLEIGYTLRMPWMQRTFGLKRIISVGLALMGTRMLLLALFPHPAVAVLTQIFHGIEVLALFVATPIFINRLAGDEFRNSMQGVFTMAVGGVARVLGGIMAGWIMMNGGLKAGLFAGAVLAAIGCLIITFLFGRIPPPHEFPGDLERRNSAS